MPWLAQEDDLAADLHIAPKQLRRVLQYLEEDQLVLRGVWSLPSLRCAAPQFRSTAPLRRPGPTQAFSLTCNRHTSPVQAL